MLDFSRFLTRLSVICCILTLAACNPIDTRSKMARFDDTVREYTSHLRWGHFREITNYMTDAYRPAAQDKISSLKNIRISRVRSSDWQASDETGNRLTGMVEIHYYASDHAIVRETQQQLVWLYDEEAKFWQLDSGLPDLLAE